MIRNQAYHGTIVKKYLHKNRDTPYIVLRKANGRIETVFIDYLIYDRVDSADYIVKQYGTLKHVVYRNDSERVFYPVCGNHIYKDDIVLEKRLYNN